MSLDHDLNDLQSMPSPTTSVNSWSPKIKPRWRFSSVETRVLESVYEKDRNPSRPKIKSLAIQLGCPMRTITTWFQNRRAKERKRIRAQARRTEPMVSHPTGAYDPSLSFADGISCLSLSSNVPAEPTTAPLFPVSHSNASTSMFECSFVLMPPVEQLLTHPAIDRVREWIPNLTVHVDDPWCDLWDDPSSWHPYSNATANDSHIPE